MDKNEAVQRLKWEGQSYFFHDAACARSFEESPERYVVAEPEKAEVRKGEEHLFDVQGMTCASCALSDEKALRKLPTVSAANVNLATHRAHVWGEADAQAVKKAIYEAGYMATPHVASQAVDYGSETRRVGRLMAISAFLTVPVFVVSMFTLSFPGSDRMQAVLTTLVVFGPGLEFHRVALRKARHGGGSMDTLVSLGAQAAWGFSFVTLLSPAPADGMRHLYFETAAIPRA